MREIKVSFLLEQEELKCLEQIVYLEPCLVDSIDAVKKENGKYRITLSEIDFKETLDALSFQAGLIQSKKERHRMMNLYEKIYRHILLAQTDQKAIRNRLS